MKQRAISSRLLTLLGIFTAGVASLPLGAAAQSGQPPQSDAWQFTVGGGVVARAAFPGSASRKTEFVPLFLASKGPLFIGSVPGTGLPFGVGYDLYQTQEMRLGVAVGGGFSKVRKEAEFARLAGLGDISNAVRGGIYGSYNVGALGVRGNVMTDLGGNKQGTLISLDVEGRAKLTGQLTVSAGPGLTWADGTYLQTVFGINAAQSVASKRPVYTAKSGVNTLRLSVSASYRIDNNWSVRAGVTAARLQGDAANSPITESKSQNAANVFVSYRF